MEIITVIAIISTKVIRSDGLIMKCNKKEIMQVLNTSAKNLILQNLIKKKNQAILFNDIF